MKGPLGTLPAAVEPSVKVDFSFVFFQAARERLMTAWMAGRHLHRSFPHAGGATARCSESRPLDFLRRLPRRLGEPVCPISHNPLPLREPQDLIYDMMEVAEGPAAAGAAPAAVKQEPPGGSKTAAAATQPAAEADAKAFPSGLRVLVVDDDPLTLRVVDQMLRRCGYCVETRGAAAPALQLLRDRRHGFDLVISDVYMPGALYGCT
jgi:hypothetical protein